MNDERDPFHRLESLIGDVDTISSQLHDALSEARTRVEREREQNERLSKAQADAIVSAALSIVDLQERSTSMRAELQNARQQLAAIEGKNRELAAAQADAIVRSAETIVQLEEVQAQLERSHDAERKARSEAERLSSFGNILDSSDNEIYIFDSQSLHFIHVNHGARANLGFSMDELRQMTPLDLKRDLRPDDFDELIDPLRRGATRAIRFTTTHTRKDESRYPVDVQLQASSFEGRPVMAAVILDITERRQLEAELRRSREKAVAADLAKSEFLANMSHEIRTPMTAILGFSDLLLDDSTSEEERESAVKTIRRNGCHLLELINDILDLSKVEAGKLEIERSKVCPWEVMGDVVDLLRRTRLVPRQHARMRDAREPPAVHRHGLHAPQAGTR